MWFVYAGGYITGLFGMNLNNTQRLQFEPYLFEKVCWVTATLIIVTTTIMVRYYMYIGELRPSRPAVPKPEVSFMNQIAIWFSNVVTWFENLRPVSRFKRVSIRPEYE